MPNKTLRGLSRRDFIRLSAAGGSLALAGGLGLKPGFGLRRAFAQDELSLVYWTVDGDEAAINAAMALFERDFGVPVVWDQQPNIEETNQRILTKTIAGDQIDVGVMHFFNRAAWTEQGIVQPITDLPGVDAYLEQMLPAARDLVTYQGEIWGLPYFLSLNTYIYNTERFEEAGFESLPTSLEELGEMALKAKMDGVMDYPIVWQAGVGLEHIGDTWIMLVSSKGGQLFDEDFNPLMESGSVARETLQWWRDTFQETQVADPASLELRWIPAIRAHATGNHIFSNTRERYMNFANDPAQSETAGQHQILPWAPPPMMATSGR
ncbi:MAG: hypothetical protein HC915_01240 [Anaerolineae bacterium]|nr:hypothetical protein [Anaerolineae bacterium]